MYHSPPDSHQATKRRGGFTLVELLAASTVFLILLGLVMAMLNQTTHVWRRSREQLDAFRSAREAFELMTQQLSEATLNPYWAYQYEVINGQQIPKTYRRESDLHFITGPGLAGTSQAVFLQAPAGMTDLAQSYGGMHQLLNDIGFYLIYDTDEPWRPAVASGIAAEPRYRLIQLMVPAEESGPYSRNRPADWYQNFLDRTATTFAEWNVPIGENIIALALLPKRAPLEETALGPLTPNFSYDSKAGALSDPQANTANQLPPMLEVLMIVINETSAARLAAAHGATPPPAIVNALANRLTDPAQLTTDLEAIADDLNAANIQHRVFRTTIAINASRWSENAQP